MLTAERTETFPLVKQEIRDTNTDIPSISQP